MSHCHFSRVGCVDTHHIIKVAYEKNICRKAKTEGACLRTLRETGIGIRYVIYHPFSTVQDQETYRHGCV